jgi:hypothetical protein
MPAPVKWLWREPWVSLSRHTYYWPVEFPGGAAVTPRVPARSIAFCTKPEALASSTNSLT